jgi:predicted nucleic acid-binding protein
MERWIFNASPLILLGKIGRLDLLPQLNSGFQIPDGVVLEILNGPMGDPAKVWLEKSEQQSRVVKSDRVPPTLLAWDLGLGETAVLAHCLSHGHCRAVLDDRAARNCAEVFGVPILGTLGILIRAKRMGFVPQLQGELDRLVESGSLLSDAVKSEALRLAGE